MGDKREGGAPFPGKSAVFRAEAQRAQRKALFLLQFDAFSGKKRKVSAACTSLYQVVLGAIFLGHSNGNCHEKAQKAQTQIGFNFAIQAGRFPAYWAIFEERDE
jgi:hypothetical protein